MAFALDDLYLFKQIVDAGGFASGARRLRLPKSTLARRMANFEKMVGSPLFHRTGRGLVLTNFGNELYARSHGFIREAERIYEFAAETREEISGHLHVVYPPVIGELVIEGLAAEFALAEPNVRLHLEATSRLVDPRTISADLVLYFSFDVLPDVDFVARRLGQSPYVLAAHPKLLAKKSPVTPDDLADYPKVGYGLTPQSWRWQINKGETHRVVDFSPVLTSTQISALITAARHGVGIGSLPMTIVGKDIAEGRLVKVLPDWQPEPATLFAVYPSGRTLTAAARHFLARLEHFFSSQEILYR